MRKQPLRSPKDPPRSHQVINQAVLFLTLFLVILGVIRLLTVLFSNETLPLRPVDGWLLMSMRAVAVLFSLGMFLIPKLRQRYMLLLLALILLTSAGIFLRLASLLPEGWQAVAGVVQLLMTVCGMGFIVAGIFLGEDLTGFIQDTWVLSVKQGLEKMGLGEDQDT